MINIKKEELYLPWKIIILYFIGCFCVYLFSPWTYTYSPSWKIFLLVITFSIISSWGYKRGISSYLKNIESDFRTDKSVSIRILQWCIVISFISLICMIIIKIGENGVPSLGNVFVNMAQAYSTKRSSDIVLDQSLGIFYKTAFFFYFSVSIGLCEYKKLIRPYRYLLILNIFLLIIYIIFYVGQQKQIGDIIILIMSAVIIKYKPTSFARLSRYKILISLIVILAVIVFSSILTNRLVMMNMTILGSSSAHYYLDPDSFIFSILPDNVALGVTYFLFYISNGFYGLNLCLQQPFVWTNGLGSCSVVLALLEQYGNIDMGNILTYPFRTEMSTGWSSTSVWHTIFPWLASDLTFPGAILFLTLGAYIYGKCWCEIKYQNKWQSIFLFSIFNIQWFYMVANNQIFTAKSTFIVFILALFFWLTRNLKIKI